MRFENTPELFGNGCGSSSAGDLHCDVCKVIFNEGNDALAEVEGNGVYMNAESITNTTFVGLTVCCECFESIENEVLRRMPDILPWYGRILAAREKRLAKDKAALSEVETALNSHPSTLNFPQQ